MSKIVPTTPSFVFGYWRPWEEDSNMFDSYLDYAKDVSLAKYGADTVGKYINQASKEQVQAINQLGQAIGRGLNVLSNQMSDINDTLGFLNRNMDIQIEQQKLSNLLLQNIAELLRVPDSEKERQHCIELGIKFFVNAKKDSDLFSDALEELLKAESLMKQDYFVLHRIGCIYLYAKKFINPEKAFDYFLRAAKYASVESDTNAVRLSNALINKFNTINSKIFNSKKQIGLLAADSYEKASFSAYVLGRFKEAVNFQIKALRFNSTSQNRFLLAKYQLRNGNKAKAIANLNKCINEQPYYAIAIFKEIDFINEAEVINLVTTKNDDIDNKIKQLAEEFKSVKSTKAKQIISELNKLSKKSYEIKILDLNKYEQERNVINTVISKLQSEIDAFIDKTKETKFLTFDINKISSIINELEVAKNLPLEKMKDVYGKLKRGIDSDKLQIGSKYAGGIVFYLDKTGIHGLVCADMDFGQAVWGGNGKIDANGNGIGDGTGMENTRKITELASWYTEDWFNEPESLSLVFLNVLKQRFFSGTKKPAPTAARLCIESNYNGYSDWYLPTKSELQLIYDNLHSIGLGAFENDNYWSSNEFTSEKATPFNFKYGSKLYEMYRHNKARVRGIRVF